MAPPTFQDSPVFADLRKAYASGDLLVFAGAGISEAAGLPTRRRLVEQMLKRLQDDASADATEMEFYVREGKLISALSIAERALGRLEMAATVEKAVDDAPIKPLPELVKAIAALRPGLRGVLTTNLDRLVERAFEGEWPEFSDPPDDIGQLREYIFKLHGTRRVRSSWVVTRDEYERAIFARRDVLFTLFQAYPILFVGCDLTDDDIEHTFSKVRALGRDQPPRHFAIVPAKATRPFSREQLEHAGIRFIEYANEDGKHTEVPAILRALLPTGKVPARALLDARGGSKAGKGARPPEQPGSVWGISRANHAAVFFGAAAGEWGARLVYATRELHAESLGSFHYPKWKELGMQSPEVATAVPTPDDVLSWLALEDVFAATCIGKLFSEVMRQSVDIRTDMDVRGDWEDRCTIALGLGFTLHTRTLLRASGMSRYVKLAWTKAPPYTDYFAFDDEPITGPDSAAGTDFAIVARIVLKNGHVHFICAGRTAPGTAAAGFYLANCWEKMKQMYEKDGVDPRTESLTVLLKHPPNWRSYHLAVEDDDRPQEIAWRFSSGKGQPRVR